MDKWYEARKIAAEAIKHFEGCHLTSYVLKGEGWATIGWGQAIPMKEHPKTITQEEADKLFDNTLLLKQKRLQNEIPAAVLDKLTPTTLAGLLCFRYNVKDSAWLSDQCNTRKALVRGDWKEFARMHGKWINGESGPLPGLKRRRRVERDLMDRLPIEAVKAAHWYQGIY